MYPLLLAGMFLVSDVAVCAPGDFSPVHEFAVESRDGVLVVSSGGQRLAEYVYRDEKILRPYFSNLRTLGGVQVTRSHPPISGRDAVDHDTMHPGLWLAFGDINGQDFLRNKGRIEHVRFVEPPALEGGRLTFATEERLLAADGALLGSVTNQFTLTRPAGAWMVLWEATFHSEAGDLAFGDQEEMGFGVRTATALTERSGGIITSSSGRKTARQTWGQAAAWCDSSGTIDGRSAGVTLMAHPANFRPTWWHNRDYGLMVANPFGREAMKQGPKSVITIKRGETFRLRFGAAIHEGDGRVAEALYQEFLKPHRERTVREIYDKARFGLRAMVADNGVMDAGIFEYGAQWVRDTSNTLLGLVHAGHFELARLLHPAGAA